MPFQADLVYRDRELIVNELLSALQSRIPNAALTPDTLWRILIEVVATPIEGLFQAVQLLHNDMFVQTAEAVSLQRYGEQYGLPQKPGTPSQGTVTIFGDGGIYIPMGTEIAAPQAGDDTLIFTTTLDGTLPNPGTPTAPSGVAGAAGTLSGTYEWAVTFVTALGETALGIPSAAVVLTSTLANISAIALGGPGTSGRNIYRMKNGAPWQFVQLLPNNSATTWTDNVTDAAAGGLPPDTTTAEKLSLSAVSSENGVIYNVGPGTIVEIADSVPGLISVTNGAAFSGGTDPENSEDYRAALLEYVRNPKTGSPADLELWAERNDGVEQATAFPNDNLGTPTNGHVTIRLSGPGGIVPSAAVQAAVLADLQSQDIANITIHVATFTPLTVTAAVVITLAPNYVLLDVTPSVQSAIADYINSIPVGGTVYRAGIIDSVFGLAGVANVTVTTPASDTTSTSVQKPVAGTVTVS